MTIAKRLVMEYPDSAHSYRLLSEAHNQIKKNAFESGDDSLVEEALVRAVEAAQRSLALDPERLENVDYLGKLNYQLLSIRSDRQKPASLPLSPRGR